MADFSGGDDDDIISIVIGIVEVSNLVYTNSLGKVSVSLLWLSNHVLSEGVEVGVLEGSELILGMVQLVLSADLLFEELKFSSVESWVADGITEEVNGLSAVSLMDLHMHVRDLSSSVSTIDGSQISERIIELSL